MTIHTIPSSGSKAAYTSPPLTRSLSPLQAYAVRAVMRRSRIGLSHALLITELAGIVREDAR